MAIDWTPLDRGGATSAPTVEHPELVRLSTPTDALYEFQGSESPGLNPAISFATTSLYAIYLELETNVGRRQLKLMPNDDPPEFKFGFRYKVGIGRATRDGSMQSFNLDLNEQVRLFEPGVAIISVPAIAVRLKGEMVIQVLTSSAPPPPPPPPSGDITAAEAVRFLNQTTFGATDATVAELMAIDDFSTWIDQQLDLPVSVTEPYVMANSNGSNDSVRHDIWWRNVMEEPDQLRQRLAYAWSQIFVVSDRDYILSNSQYGISNYYDMLARSADGNFRTLLEQVTLHPVMGVYLSMLRNERADPARNVRPDENFAREILQLFTIGLYELTRDGRLVPDASGQPIPTFDQPLIEEFAKVFTGWNYDGVRDWTDNNIPASSRQVPMVPEEAFHDTTRKRLLSGTVLRAGRSAYADLTGALDNIFNHRNVGPFVSRLLIQRLVSSNPSHRYIGRVAAVFNDNGAGIRGDLRAVTKAILLDDEARNGPETRPATFGKIKEPVLRLSNLWRTFNAQPGPEAGGIYRPYARPTYVIEDVIGQGVLRSPSVFNFYLPDNPLEPGSNLDGPEMQILSEINVASTNNMLLQCIYGDNNRSTEYRQNITQIQIEPEVELAADVEALVDRLDLMLAAGQLAPDVRTAIIDLISSHPSNDEGRYQRVLDAVYCIVGSPSHLVQK